MKYRLQQDAVAIGLSVAGLASGAWLLGKAAIETVGGIRDWIDTVTCGPLCQHDEAGDEL